MEHVFDFYKPDPSRLYFLYYRFGISCCWWI